MRRLFAQTREGGVGADKHAVGAEYLADVARLVLDAGRDLVGESKDAGVAPSGGTTEGGLLD